MKLTIELAKQKYQEFNKLYFNNELPTEVEFTYFKSKDSLAMCGYKRAERIITFYLNEKIDFHNELILNEVMLHEMIHAKQFHFNMKDQKHGQAFKFNALLIKEASNGLYDIKRTCTSSAFTIENKTNKIEKCLLLIMNRVEGKYYRVYKNVDEKKFADMAIKLIKVNPNIKVYRYSGTAFNNDKSCRIDSRKLNFSILSEKIFNEIEGK